MIDGDFITGMIKTTGRAGDGIWNHIVNSVEHVKWNDSFLLQRQAFTFSGEFIKQVWNFINHKNFLKF